MIEEPAHVHAYLQSWRVAQSAAEPNRQLLNVALSASTDLSSIDIEAVRQKILRDGIRIYVTGTVEAEMLAAMRSALARAEHDREQYRVRADHFERKASDVEAQLEALKRTLSKEQEILHVLHKALRAFYP
jgi:hypothetical protein